MKRLSMYQKYMKCRQNKEVYMEDRIEVGEYVRTKEGEIHKVIKIIEDDGDWDYYCCENNTGYFAMDIAKHNKQRIDLIEVRRYY